MIAGFLVEHGAVLLSGVTLVMFVGLAIAIAQQSPIARLRSCEATIACLLLWLIAAGIPLPRFFPASSPETTSADAHRRTPASADFTGDSGLWGDRRDVLTEAVPPVPRSADAKRVLAEPSDARVAPIRQPAQAVVTPVTFAGDAAKTTATRASMVEVASVVYLVGGIASCLWLMVGRLLLLRITAGARRLAADDQLLSGVTSIGQRAPRILLSPGCGRPFSFGLLCPTVVLPDGFGSPPELRQAIRHELAHIQQCDALGRLLFNAAFPLLWFHPLYWWLRDQASFSAELVADEIASRGSSREAYARDLIALARRAGRLESLVLGVSGMFGFSSQFYCRMKWLVSRSDGLSTRCSVRRRSLLMVTFTILLAVTSGFLGLRHSTAQRAERPSTRGPGTRSPRTAGPPWYLNNVLSTSPTTPGFARLVPQDQTVLVRGTVLDAHGRPAAGADVWAASVFIEPPYRERVRADGNGRFSLRLKPFATKSGRWAICAIQGNQGGNDYNTEWLSVAKPIQSAPIVIRMSERGVVRGRLMAHESGAGVPDGRLYLGDGRIIEADESGRYSIHGLQQGNQRMVVVAAGRERKRVIFDTTLRPAAELDVRLKTGGQIRGRVVDENNQPVPFAYAKVPGSGVALALDGRCVVADENGEFVWDGAPLDRTIRAMNAGAPGFSTLQHNQLSAMVRGEESLVFQLKLTRPPGVATVKSRPAKELAVQPHKLRDLAGIVRGPDEQPIANAMVRWGATLYEAVDREVRSDANGRFVLKQVPDREAYATVIADGLAPRFVHVKQNQRDVEISLKAGRMVGGVVVSRSGKPLSGVSVVTVIPSPDPSLCNPFWISERGTRTDADGRFEISALPNYGTFDFLRSDLTEIRNRELKFDSLDNKVQMNSSGAIRGRVVDGDGKPIRDFRVLIGFPRRRGQGDVLSGYSAVYGVIGVSFTNKTGEFVIGDLPVGGTFRVRATADGFSEAVADRVVAVPASDLPPAEKLVLQLGPPTSLGVRIIDARSGRPIENAHVTLINRTPNTDKDFRWNSTEVGWPGIRSDVNGWAIFAALPNIESTVSVRHPDFAHHRFGWRKREKEFTVRLQPSCVVEGIVASESGVPLKGIYVNLNSLDQQQDYAEIKASNAGRFRIAELPAGRYQLTIRGERRTFLNQAIELKCAETKRLTIKADTSAGRAVLEDQTSTGVLEEAIATSVNGEAVGDQSLEKVLVEFRDTFLGPDATKLLQNLEEANFRKSIRAALAQQAQEFKAQPQNAEYEKYFRELCLPIYQHIAEEGVWPFGTTIAYYRGHIQVDIVTASTNFEFTRFSLSFAVE